MTGPFYEQTGMEWGLSAEVLLQYRDIRAKAGDARQGCGRVVVAAVVIAEAAFVSGSTRIHTR